MKTKKIKGYFNYKWHEERFNKEKIGKILLKDEYGKGRPEIKEKEYQILSVMETFQRKFEYKTILKAFDNLMNKKHRLALQDSESHVKNGLHFDKRKFTPIRKNRSHSAAKLFNVNYSKIKSNKKQKSFSKTLSYESFPWIKKNILPITEKIKKIDRKIISVPPNFNNVNFTQSINLRMDLLKKCEKEYLLKKNASYLTLNPTNKSNYNKIIHKGRNKNYYNRKEEEDEFEINNESKNNEIENNIYCEKDPFKEIKNSFEYGKVMKKLRETYLFYPYSYLEEHKNIDPDKFKFMIDNFNSKFSLFGRERNLMEDKERNYKKKLKLNFYNKPSSKIMKRIIRNKQNEDV